MAIRKIPKDTKTFHYFNANPKDNRSCDCTVRAIALATGLDWDEVLSGMYETGMKLKRMPNDLKNIEQYLKNLGYSKMPMPKKRDGKKYTVAEFTKITLPEHNYICSVANHFVCVTDKKAWDTWDSTSKCVGNYWIVPDPKDNQHKKQDKQQPKKPVKVRL